MRFPLKCQAVFHDAAKWDLSYHKNIINRTNEVFYYYKAACYSIDTKRKAKEVKTMKKLTRFLEEYFEICAHK